LLVFYNVKIRYKTKKIVAKLKNTFYICLIERTNTGNVAFSLNEGGRRIATTAPVTLILFDMQKLTKAEEEVMHLIWEIGRGTVSDLLEKFPEPKPPHSTISSVVRILEKKGFVDHKAYGKTHDYFPVVSKEEYGSRTLGDVLRDYFDGSVSRLVSHLTEEEKLSPEELDALRKLLE